MAAWPALRLLHLRLSRTQVTPAGLAHLQDLPCPRLLDLRGTAVKRLALLPLQRKWGLQPLQGGAMLADSITSSAESPLGRNVICACGRRPLQGECQHLFIWNGCCCKCSMQCTRANGQRSSLILGHGALAATVGAFCESGCAACLPADCAPCRIDS